MASIEISETYTCSPHELWAIIGDPGRTDWVPSVQSCAFNGETRTMQMEGAGTIVEQIFRLDHDAMEIEYGVVESAAPLRHHRARIRLSESASGTLLHWRTDVEPDQFGGFIEQGMQAGIAGLHAVLAAG